jgi:hypothetical protein
MPKSGGFASALKGKRPTSENHSEAQNAPPLGRRLLQRREFAGPPEGGRYRGKSRSKDRTLHTTELRCYGGGGVDGGGEVDGMAVVEAAEVFDGFVDG